MLIEQIEVKESLSACGYGLCIRKELVVKLAVKEKIVLIVKPGIKGDVKQWVRIYLTAMVFY